MTHHRIKLHPSSCFPSNPVVANTQNRLFIRIAPKQSSHSCSCLTFIGINDTTYSAIAALLAYRPLVPIESIKLFDICQKLEARTTLNDLQLVAILNKTNIHLQWAQSYWETKDSTVIIINVQHHQLENESTSTWIQMNASLVEDIVSQVCMYSPQATLIICTQPNELMTYVAWRVSKFPSERILGLGASVDTAYAHKTIRDQTDNIHSRINGFFVLGNGRTNESCTNVLTHHLTMNGIDCSNIMTNQSISEQRRIEMSPTTKPRSNWTEAMIIVHIIRALVSNKEFQSNFTVNIALMNNSTDVFINYPTIIGSSPNVIKYPLPFRQAHTILEQRSFLIPYEKLQRKIRLLKSKD